MGGIKRPDVSHLQARSENIYNDVIHEKLIDTCIPAKKKNLHRFHSFPYIALSTSARAVAILSHDPGRGFRPLARRRRRRRRRPLARRGRRRSRICRRPDPVHLDPDLPKRPPVLDVQRPLDSRPRPHPLDLLVGIFVIGAIVIVLGCEYHTWYIPQTTVI